MPPNSTTRHHTRHPVEVERRAIGPTRRHAQSVTDPLASPDRLACQRAEARVTALEAALTASRNEVRTLVEQSERMARTTRDAEERARAAEARVATLEQQALRLPAPASAPERRALSGADLRALREKRGWTQRDVGRRAGIVQALVSLVERDKAAPWNVTAVTRALVGETG